MTNGPTTGQNRPSSWIPILILVAAAFLVHANTLPNGLTLDDTAIIGDNPLIQGLSPLSRYLEAGWWSGQQGYGDHLYRPLTLFTFGLQYAIHGTAPLGYHLVNILLYALCLPAIYRLLRRLSGSRAGAFWGSLVFALHAVHSEAVANIVGRAELLTFLFGITVLWLHARDYRLLNLGRAAVLPLALVLFFCAAACKESALAWLPVLMLWDLAVLSPGRKPVRSLITGFVRTHAYYLIPSGAYLMLRLAALTASPGTGSVYYPVNPLAWADTAVRILTGIKLLFYQQLLVLFPFRLSSDYSLASISEVHSMLDPVFLLALTVQLALVTGALLAWRRHRPLFFAVAFYYTTALISSNIPLAIGTIFGERLLFTPSLALAVAAAWLLRRVEPMTRRRVHALGLAALWLTASAITALGRGPQWRDNSTLFLHDLEVQPKSVVLMLRAAEIHRDEGDLAKAERLLLQSLEQLPDDPVALNNLGELYRLAGRHREAEVRLHQALQAGAGPRWAPVPRNRALPCFNLGLISLAQADYLEAVHWLDKAVMLDPDDIQIQDSLLQATMAGSLESAFLQRLLRAEARFPGRPQWRYYRGLFELYMRKSPAAAETHLAAALAADPGELRFHIALADLKAGMGRWQESSALYQGVLDHFDLQPVQAAEIRSRLNILRRQAGGN